MGNPLLDLEFQKAALPNLVQIGLWVLCNPLLRHAKGRICDIFNLPDLTSQGGHISRVLDNLERSWQVEIFCKGGEGTIFIDFHQ